MSFSRTPLQMAGDFFKEYALYFVFVILLAVIITQDSTFLNITNLSNILTQSSVRMIIALGVAGVIVTRGTDLSVGRQVGLAAVVAATMLQAVDNVNKVFPEMGVMPIPVVILLVCAIGALIGLLNGIIVAILNVTPFIATLGTMLIAYGVNSLYYDAVGSAPIAGFDSAFRSFTQGYFSIPMGGLGNFRLSYITIYALVAIVFTWVLWNKTRFGKNLFAIGGNPEAAAVSGVNVTLNLIGIYVLSGIFYAFGGMLEAGRIGSATNNLGFMYELDAIAACVIGGVSFSGGVGTVAGVVMGVIIFQLLNYGLSYIGVNPYWQYIIKGGIIVLAVVIELARRVAREQMEQNTLLDNPDAVREYLGLTLRGLEHEAFVALFLNSQHRLITADMMFKGTVNQTAVYPREVLKHALKLNAAAVILSHNHPSGHPETSDAAWGMTAFGL